MTVYMFKSLGDLAQQLDTYAAEARTEAKGMSNLGPTNRAKIAAHNNRAYGFEQSAHIVRNSIIIDTSKGAAEGLKQ